MGGHDAHATGTLGAKAILVAGMEVLFRRGSRRSLVMSANFLLLQPRVQNRRQSATTTRSISMARGSGSCSDCVCKLLLTSGVMGLLTGPHLEIPC